MKDKPRRGPGRPKGSKNKAPRRDKGIRRKPLVETPERFKTPRPRGGPRKDGMPPIQRKRVSICPITGKPEVEEIAPEELRKVEKLTKLLARIRHLAGRGLLPPHISVLTGVAVADLSPGGMYYDDVETGRAEAVLAVAENHYDRVLQGKSTHEVMFYLKSIGGWSETADGRKKSRGEIGEPEEIKGIDITFDDEEEEVQEVREPGNSEGHGD
jgi:hypothetical protein